MKTTHAATLIAILAGSTAAFAHSDHGPDAGQERGNSYSCSISAWIWEGGFGNNFFASPNWFDCGVFNGPTPQLQIYFGPVARFLNGAYIGDFFPAGPAVMDGDFSSPSLEMLSNSDTQLTISGATYTTNGVIGRRSTNFDHIGTATLILDNAVFNGNLTLGQNGGNACLVASGTSRVEGSISLGGGNAVIKNSGDLSFSSTFDGRSGDLFVQNNAGGRLGLFASFTLGDDNDRLVNEPGATIAVGPDSNVSIDWNFINNGTVSIDNAILTLSDSLSGDAPITLVNGGRVALSSLQLDDHLEIDGTGSLTATSVDGPAQLDLTGTIDIDSWSTGIDGIDVNIIGDIDLNTSIDGRSRSGTWSVKPGTVFLLDTSFILGDDNDRLVNEPGATIAVGPDSNVSIGWEFINDGTLTIDTTTLTIVQPEPEFKSTTSTISGDGRLHFSGAPALFNAGTLNPTARDNSTNPDGLTIDVPFIQNNDTAVFRTQVGSLSGKLTCTGVYDVGGTVDIQRFGDFEPDGSESFVVIEADFVSGVFGDYFDNAVPFMGSDTAFGVRTGDLEYDLTYTPTTVVISNVSVIVPPCNPADLAEPTGTLDLADISAFVTAFAAGDDAADLAEPLGVIDLADIAVFVSAFTAGCP